MDLLDATPIGLTRRAIAASNSGDYEAMVAFYGEDSLFDLSRIGLGVYRGPASIRSFFEDWIGACDAFSTWPEQLEDLGGGVVCVDVEQRARPAGRRAALELRFGSVFVWEQRTAMRVVNYPDVDLARRRALRARRQAPRLRVSA